MSSVYISEPPTKGKVVMHTSMGDIEIELWSKEAPLACRNFIQLSLEGYYDNTIFHRIVPKFCVQGGDPTGTGEGGESIYGKPFDDEFHSRLRFTRRGLMGMANKGKNQNESQFFFTFDATPELNHKNTLFGKIVGSTLFNMLKMEELEIDSETERPLYPPKILSISIIHNPFDDILPRITSEEKKAAELAEKLKNEIKKPKKKEKKRLNLLSFGAEEEEQEKDLEASNINTKIKSSHDLLTEDVHLSNKVSVDLEMNNDKVKKEKDNKKKEKDVLTNNSNEVDENKEAKKKFKSIDEIKSEKMRNIQDEIDKIKKEFIEKDKKKSSKEKDKDDKKKKKKRGLELLQMEREKYMNSSKAIIKKNKKHKSSHDEDETLKLMLNFKKQLQDITYSENRSNKSRKEQNVEIDEHGLCKLHNKKNCLSCQAMFNERNQKELLGEISDEDDKSDDENWLSHNLVFEDEGSKDIFKVDDYIVIDPREREKQAKKEYYTRKQEKLAKPFKSSHHLHHRH
ncbi:peptidyl-prolyl isomerase cwc27 [Neocallimastix lanati (nom. inval.)]|jgi:cyclophilin family peptidyl-prolyl cis-trans isomerase|nr:peptidyl-prolyl isomerase cwc27 [Neocallimastix sp. JGI-2020a]